MQAVPAVILRRTTLYRHHPARLSDCTRNEQADVHAARQPSTVEPCRLAPPGFSSSSRPVMYFMASRFDLPRRALIRFGGSFERRGTKAMENGL